MNPDGFRFHLNEEFPKYWLCMIEVIECVVTKIVEGCPILLINFFVIYDWCDEFREKNDIYIYCV